MLIVITFVGLDNKLYKMHGKGKAIPIQAWRGPEDSRRLRLPVFKTIST
jgi:hypothetical protein